jgi:hypothetical protein
VNAHFLIKVAGQPGWWLILMFIPLVNLFVWTILCMDLAISFRKWTGFGAGLLWLPFIFFLILGFGNAQYQGPAAGEGVAVSRLSQAG